MILIDIVTPIKRLVVGLKVNEVRIPASKGEIQVLPGHAELLTTLNTGVLSLTSDGEARHFAISYGFADIRNDTIVILGETVEESKDIDVARAKLAQKKAEEKLTSLLEEGQFRKHQLKLQRSLIRQKVAL